MEHRAGYLIRISGLKDPKRGDLLQALFLCQVTDDEYARRRAREVSANDPRITLHALYAYELVEGTSRSSISSVYLHTGIPLKTEGHVHNFFFIALSDAAARHAVAARGWEEENRLYRCKRIPM
jgi:hypothetical protein